MAVTARARVLSLCLALVAALVLSVSSVGAPAPAAAADPCASGPAPTGGANPVRTGNPLDNSAWAVGWGGWEEAWTNYCRSTGTEKALLGKIALKPRMLWLGHWFKTSELRSAARQYIAKAQRGNSNRLVQLGVFRVWPRGEGGRDIPLTKAEQADYRAWIRELAAAIGGARVAIVLEPDLAIAAYDSVDRSVRLGLARYAAATLSQLPRVSIYICAGASDWLTVEKAALMLRRAGITYVRGFALGGTHYATLPKEIDYARRVARLLGSQGFSGKRAIIDTTDNVKGFTYHQYYAEHPSGWFDNAEVCRSRTDKTCVTLGVPPTWKVYRSGIGLGPKQKEMARTYVDAYTWFSRPWFYAQASPWRQTRALQLARTSPY